MLFIVAILPTVLDRVNEFVLVLKNNFVKESCLCPIRGANNSLLIGSWFARITFNRNLFLLKNVCVPMPTHCTITCFGFRTRWIDGVDCGLFSILAPLGQTTLRVGRVSV